MVDGAGRDCSCARVCVHIHAHFIYLFFISSVRNKTKIGVFVDGKKIYEYQGKDSDKDYIPVPSNTTGQIIRIQRLLEIPRDSRALAFPLMLCQVEVYSK